MPRADVERVFISNLKGSGFIPRYGDAAAALQLADLVCVHFGQGGNMEGLVGTVMQDATMPESEFRGFAAVAAVAFCPEHVSKVVGG